LLILLPYHDRNIRADLSTKGTPGAGFLTLPEGIKIPLPVHLFANSDQFLWTRDCTETTPLAPVWVNFNPGHDHFIRGRIAFKKIYKINNIIGLEMANTS
jgi:hypothetical protein